MSPVTFTDMPIATDPPHANSPNIYSRVVHKHPKTFFFKQKIIETLEKKRVSYFCNISDILLDKKSLALSVLVVNGG